MPEWTAPLAVSPLTLAQQTGSTTADDNTLRSVQDWWATLPLNDAPPWMFAVLRVLVVVVVVTIFYRMARRAVNSLVKRRKLNPGLSVMMNRVIFWIAVAAVVFFSLQALGILQDAWTTLTAIIAMVAIGFVAVWSVLSNALCSLILMFARPFMVGDTIEIKSDNLKGKVIDFSMIYTTLEPEEGGVIRIPNNLFFQKAIHCLPGAKQIALDEQLDEDEPAN